MRVARTSQDQGGALVRVAEERPEMYGGSIGENQAAGAKVEIDLLFDGQGFRVDDPVTLGGKRSLQRSFLQELAPG